MLRDRITRISERYPNKWVLPQGKGAWREICDRLKAYEDTDLEPDEIVSLQKELEMLKHKLKVAEQRYLYKVPGNRDSYSKYNEGWQDAVDFIEGTVK